MTMKFLKKFFVKNSSLKVRKSDDHRILMKCFKNFDQNSGGQPQYLTDQLQDLIQLLAMKLRVGVKKIHLGSDKCGYRSLSWELGLKSMGQICRKDVRLFQIHSFSNVSPVSDLVISFLGQKTWPNLCQCCSLTNLI